MPDPSVYAVLMDRGTRGLELEVERRLQGEAARAAHSATGWVHDQIRQAYVAGVADGFVQGVAAQDAAAREQEQGGDA